jgi:hypothetical protein
MKFSQFDPISNKMAQGKKKPDQDLQVRETVFILGEQTRLQSAGGHRPVKLRAGLLALGSLYSPSLPTRTGSGIPAAFVPDYSGGSATAFHRFPQRPLLRVLRSLQHVFWPSAF